MSKKIKLIPEEYPENYNGYKFISLIKYMDKSHITIVDNLINDTIHAYVLDECAQKGLDEKEIVLVAKDWFEEYSSEIPLSIFLFRNNMSHYNQIIKCYPVDYVSRVLGPLFHFNMGSPIKIKRKRKKEISENIEIIKRPIRKIYDIV